MGCACSRAVAAADAPAKGVHKQLQVQARRGGGQQGSSDAPGRAASSGGAATPDSPLSKLPSADSARHNSGHLSSSTTSSKGSAGKPEKAPAAAMPDPQASAQLEELPGVAAQQPSTGGSGGDLAAVLANALNMAAATVVLTAAGRPQPSSGSSLTETAAALAYDLAKPQHREARREVVVIMDIAQDRRTQRKSLDGQLAALRFFAGAPLLSSDGQLLGTLCICDTEARQFGTAACMLLANCAAVAARELEAGESSRHGPGAHSSACRRLPSRHGSRRVSSDGAPQTPPQLPPMLLHRQQLLAAQPYAGRDFTASGSSTRCSSFEPAAGSSRSSASFPARMTDSPVSCDGGGSFGGSGGTHHFGAAGQMPLRSPGTGAATGSPPVTTPPTPGSGCLQQPAAGFRSDTANPRCLALYRTQQIEAAAAAGAAYGGLDATPGAAQPLVNHPTPQPPLQCEAPGAPATLPRVSPFASQAHEDFPPEDEDLPPEDEEELATEISTAATAEAQLAAREASTGSSTGGSLPPRRRPPGPPEAPAQKAGSTPEQLDWDCSTGRQMQSRRSASLPLAGPAHGPAPANPDSAGMATSASVGSHGSARSRHGCGVATPPKPQPARPLRLISPRSSRDIADELLAEMGLSPADADGSSAGLGQAPGPAAASVALIDASLAGWRLLHVTEGFSAATGIPIGDRGAFWQHFELRGVEGPMSAEPWRHFGQRVLRAVSFGMAVVGTAPSRSRPSTFKFSLSPASKQMLYDDSAVLLPTAGLAGSCAADAVPYGLYFVTLQSANEPSSRGSLDLSSGSSRLSGSGGGSGGGQLLSSCRSTSMRSEPSPSMTPFADVRLGGLLGKGSFGSVYLGWRGDQEVAVKVIHHTGVMGKATAKELEATLGQRLEHPNIVRTYDYATRTSGTAATLKRASSRFASGGSSMRRGSGSGAGGSGVEAASLTARQHETWILLEVCNGGSLQVINHAGRLRMSAGRGSAQEADADPGQLPPPDMQQLLACAAEISEAMRYLHTCGMMHGDLTSNNVLLAEDKTDPRGFKTKVSDFGLSRSMHAESNLCTNTFGTVTHMPPELLSEGQLSKAADVYSFGVMLWELYCMQRPWAELRPIQVIMQKASGALALQWPRSTPTLYQHLAEECMSNDPELRPAFAEVAQRCQDMALAAAAGGLVTRPSTCTAAADDAAASGDSAGP